MSLIKMLKMLKMLKMVTYASLPTMWYYSGTLKHENVKPYMFNKGFTLSQKFKEYPVWDNFCEPFIIRQSTIIFAGGNAFIKGMVSDNENTGVIDQDLKLYKKDINDELNDLSKE